MTRRRQIPKWPWTWRHAMIGRDEPFARWYEWDERIWITNGHILIWSDMPVGPSWQPLCLDLSTAKSLRVMRNIHGTSGRSARAGPVYIERSGTCYERRDIGDATVAAPYVDLLERLFPGATWRVRGESQPVRLVRDGAIVAAVMPMRG